MDFRILVPLVSSVVYILLLLVIAFQRPFQKQQMIFIIYLIAAVVWSSSDAILRSHFLEDYKIIIFRVVVCASLWWAVQLYCFARSFMGLPPGLGMKYGYASLAIFVILAALGYAPPSLTFQEGAVSPAYGWWFIFYVLPLIIVACWGTYSLVQRLRNISSPEAHNKIAYLIVAIFLLVFFGFVGVSQLAHEFPLSHFGGLLSACVLTYAVVQHELISISYILRRLLGLVTLALIGVGVFLISFLLIHLLVGIKLNVVTLVVAGVLVLIVAPAIFRLRNLYLGKIDQLFYREKYKHRQELFDFVKHGIRGVFSLQELSQGILPPLVKVLNCHRAYMLLPMANQYVAAFSEPQIEDNSSLRIRADSPIVVWLQKEYLTKEKIDIHPEFRGLWEKEREEIRSSGIELFFPLISRGMLIGILALGRKQSGKYSLEDADLVESISNQVAISLEKESFQEELKKREQELTIINKLSMVMTSSLNIEDIYDGFIKGLREVIDVHFAAIVLAEDNRLRFSALSSDVGSIWQVGQQIDIKGTGTEWIIKNKRSVVESDLQENSMFVTDKKYLERGIRSIIYLPLIAKGDGIGSLIIASCRPDAYNEGQKHLLERLASQISTSVANSQLYARAEQRARVDELTGLFNRRHFDEIIKLEIDRHHRHGNIMCLAFFDLDNFKNYNDTLGHMAGDRVLERAGNLLRNTIRSIDTAFRYGGDEFAVVMPHASTENGHLAAERIRKALLNEFKDEQIKLTASFGLACWPSDGLTADSIMNAADQALYHAKRTGGNRICLVSEIMLESSEKTELVPTTEKEVLSVIYALAATIEARDPYTFGHSQKVRQYAVALAEAIGLPAGKVAVVSHAALLHDIGKIGIYDEILNKAGKLDIDERKLIEIHPQLSRNIVQHVPSLTPCLPAILHHHERWDGSGYPEGLKGETIPLEARILAVADSFDAMTSKRPYRDPLSYEKAVRELKRCAGSQFDSKLIDAFLPVALTINIEEPRVTGKVAVNMSS